MGVIRFHEFELDLGGYELRRNGRALKLERIPLELLIQLVEKKGDLLTREEIVARVWGQDVFVESEQGINTAIRKIRQVLRDDPEHPRFVQTVVGRGYRFVAPVQSENHSDVEQTTVTPVQVPAEASLLPSNGRTRRRLWLTGLAATCLLGLLAGHYAGALRERLFGARKPPLINSLAVLPLENLSGDSAQDYFVDGITEGLITALGKISSLQVISRTSVMRYKGSNKPLPEIARELSVDAVIEGAVMRSGSRVRVTAQLIDARTDRHLWADEYDYELRDVMTLQSEVARAIASEIRVKLTPLEQERLAAHRSVNPEAFEAYLKGRSFWNKRTEFSLKKAIEHFQFAIERDPNYALAYSGLADCYSILGVYTYLAPEDAFPRAKAAALKSLELDDSLAEAHVSLGIVRERLDWDWGEVDKHQRRAIELDPGYATAHHWRSYHLHLMGRFDESFSEMKLAWRLDPFSLPINTSLGTALLYARRYDEATRKYQEAEDLDPNFILVHGELSRVYVQTNQFDLAIAEAQRATALSDQLPRFLAEVGYAFAVAGREPEAREILQKLKVASKKRYVSPHDVALIYAGLNDKDAAFEWLEKAFQERSAWLPWLNRDPRWDVLRSDQRFENLARRIGLPP